MKHFDVCIIGGGHAGIEAAWIAAQFSGVRVTLISLPNVPWASAPCNSSIGGVGKGQLVREVDAMGGLMGNLADRAGIHFRTLNESKGFAVQSTRVQIDKDLYSKYAGETLATNPDINLIRSQVCSLERAASGTFHLSLDGGSVLSARCVVITTGTFLGGLLHTGPESWRGGRIDCQSSSPLRDLVPFIKFRDIRFKTGTPPRLKRGSIDFSSLTPQLSDCTASTFHVFSSVTERHLPQETCFLTRTNAQTLKIIRDNKHRSPLFNGQISGIGPRYCPSLEDKAFRYIDRDGHQIFLEPEGLSNENIYPSGISTSLPKDVQESFLKTICGLENVQIAQYGYAVEYDVVDTSTLNHALEHREISGLYFAGQINGTSGYEEAAGQGFVAGMNAALRASGRDLLFFDRNDSYLGVMIDDLVTSQRDEPYRLFTARSENRLFLREDNAFLRMSRYRQALNLGSSFDLKMKNLVAEYEFTLKFVRSTIIPRQVLDYGLLDGPIGLAEFLKRPEFNPVDLLRCEFSRIGISISERVSMAVAIMIKYEGHITRALESNSKFNKLKVKAINWKMLIENKNISYECRLRISKFMPENFYQLQNIDGIRPATLSYVAGLIS
ncbi:MAG: tRNA uridine-5-carboxymethylaminomethyl(34) synthesis enzyme MnmG [Bdellovibrionales bacterium GWA2_49_15]|nr:MAG: tRNA uridine-5-carboxymethylaminomethyl(34) synthesis enzyme MnmG [Bdellovibrionales bacterium GWA2_49_15]